MLKLGNQSISAAYLGGMEVRKAYLEETVVFDTSAPPVSTYTISAAIDPAGSGTVSGIGSYPAGETITIAAVPGDGYQFTGWQENSAVVSVDAEYTFTVTEDRALVAVFAAVKPSRLPNGYTEVEYIQNSTENSYIDTGKRVNDSNVTYIVQAPEWKRSSTAKYFSQSLSIKVEYSIIRIFTYISSSSNGEDNIYTDMNTGKLTIAINQTIVDVNGYKSTLSRKNYSADSICVPGKGSSSPALITRIFYFKGEKTSSTSETYNFEFIPCVNASGTPGLYDLVSKTFKSAASGSFIAGPAV